MTRQAASRPPTVAFIAHSLNLETGGGSNRSLHQLACGLSDAGEAGLTFRAEDADDLSEKIETLANDSSLLASLSDAAPSRVSDFKREEILARLLGIYRDLSPAFADQARGAP